MWNRSGAGKFRWETSRCLISRRTCAWSRTARQIFRDQKRSEHPASRRPKSIRFENCAVCASRMAKSCGTIRACRWPRKAEHFEFAMDYASDAGKPVYLGQISWQQFEVAALRYHAVYLGFLREIHAPAGFVFPDTIAMEDSSQRNRRAGESRQFFAARMELPVSRPGSLRGSLVRSCAKRGAPGGHMEFTGEGRYDGQTIERQRTLHGRSNRHEVFVVPPGKSFPRTAAITRTSARWIARS